MKKVLIIFLVLFLLTSCGVKNEKFETANEIVPTMIDKIGEDGIWCATFQLIWNDLKNEVLQKPVEIDNQIARNLNQETFKEDEISSEYYYKTYGMATKELRETIERNLKEKFNQESEILDQFDWNGDLIFYTMLYREFEFESKFDRLSNTDFGKYKDVKYFGINSSSKEELRNQITILFYENDQNFAISIKTKSNDEVIMYKNPKGETFEEIYNELKNKSNSYDGNIHLSNNDEFKAPLISIKKIREYDEITNKPFTDYKMDEYFISKAIQTIEFELDEKGGKIKSEAGMGVKNTSFMPREPKKLYLNDTFALFLKETSKEKPYFAAKITDITKFTSKN